MPEVTPTPTPVYLLKNECDTFTLFDLGVQCLSVVFPSSATSNDGVLSLLITGGTTPYTILWENGQVGPTLYNLPPGDYPVTVIDYYGDYTANTVCSLFGPTPTPTPSMTPTVTPSATPTWPNLCFIATYGTTTYGPYQFVPSGNQNGKPTWNYTSGSTIYNIVWTISPTVSRWVMQGWNVLGGTLVSNNTGFIPDSSWVEIGAANNPIISVNQGTCPEKLPLINQITKNNNSCSQTINCNGSIIINTTGGVPPYTYSINGGVTYQTSNSFVGLCPQTYTVVTKDSSGSTITNLVSILSDGNLVTYTISVNNLGVESPTPSSKVASWKVNVTPAIPVGTTISFQLSIASDQYVNQPGTGVITSTNKVYKNGTLQVAPTPTTNTSTIDRPNCSPYQTEVTNKTEIYNLTMTANDIITGTSTSLLTITSPQIGQNGCVTQLEQDINVIATQPTTNGCTCCTVLSNPDSKGGVVDHTLSTGQSGGGGLPDYVINISGIPITPGSSFFVPGSIVVNNAPVTLTLKAFGGATNGGSTQAFISINSLGNFQTSVAYQYQTTQTSITIPTNGTYYVSSMYGIFNGTSGNYITIT